jgi:hypothetical protein
MPDIGLRERRRAAVDLSAAEQAGKANRNMEAEAAAWRLRAAHDLGVLNSNLSNVGTIVLSIYSHVNFIRGEV